MERQLEHYVKALIPDTYYIYGVKLKPFCLGHIFLMKRFDCGFADDNPLRKGGLDDLLLGIAICSRSYEEFIQFMADPKEFTRWFKMWGKKIRKAIKKKQLSVFQGFFDFSVYMKSGVVMPKYWDANIDSDETPTGSHWTQSVFTTLISELGYSQEEALNVPVAKGISDYFKHLERAGIISLMRDDEIEAIEKAEQEKRISELAKEANV